MTTQRLYHVAARIDCNGMIDDTEVFTTETVATVDEAIAVLKGRGFEVILPGDGGDVDTYDAEDGPRCYEYEADGCGIIGITARRA